MMKCAREFRSHVIMSCEQTLQIECAYACRVHHRSAAIVAHTLAVLIHYQNIKCNCFVVLFVLIVKLTNDDDDDDDDLSVRMHVRVCGRYCFVKRNISSTEQTQNCIRYHTYRYIHYIDHTYIYCTSCM